MINTRISLFLVFLCLSLFTDHAFAQSRRRMVYDSSIVGDRITPSVSSVMMPKTYSEVLLSNTLSTANTYFKSDRSKINLTERDTYLINTLQVTHGISASGRLNVGLDISYRMARSDANRTSSPTKVFGNDGTGLRNYARGFTSLGVRARYALTEKRNFVIQHTFYLPFQKATNDTQFLGDVRYALNTQFLYNQLIGRKVFLFAQGDIFIQFKTDHTPSYYNAPLNVYGTYLLTRNFFPFVQIGMSNTFNKDVKLSGQSYTYGVGLQYQFTTMFTINAFYNDVFAGKTYSDWRNFSFGVRAVL
ncbi:MAG: hypothetical protein ABJA70_14050 [Chryseolinea sp.]